MNLRIIGVDFVVSFKGWIRSKGTIFWSIFFPVLLILLFGAIFSGSDSPSYTLQIQDLDDSQSSQMYLDMLKNISILKIEMINASENITDYIQKNDLKGAMVIPKGFGDTIALSHIDKDASVNLSFYFDPSDQGSTSVVRSIIGSSLQEFNLALSKGSHTIGMDSVSTITSNFKYIDFFIPGMIGFTIMQLCIYGSIERNTKYRKDGILRKLLTTPITRTEWLLSKMLFTMFLSLFSTLIACLIGILVWGVVIHVNLWMITIIFATSFLFSGIGMIIGRFVKEEETADTAAGAISFPMMFLAGTFFPLQQMPMFLQEFAKVLPLYYVNEGLRNAMISLDFDKAAYNGIIVIVFALVFFIAGVLLTKWKED
ncbi:MAG: ABC transporter permease [Euryarchaeota archaeon]|nr:ABC transporter permease [Euryarchaeota archaeon]